MLRFAEILEVVADEILVGSNWRFPQHDKGKDGGKGVREERDPSLGI